jgi:uncharacterized protein (DUF486 family)
MDAHFWKTAGLLVLSNTFMTLAWYGHLRFKEAPLILAIFLSWLVALPEYALQVPANRLGYEKFSGYDLKILQECITLVVFMIFAFFVLKETPGWRHLLAFGLILTAVVVTYGGR